MAHRKLRSSTVILGGMGALAMTLTACGSSEPDKRCVDRNDITGSGYRVLSDSECRAGGSGGLSSSGSSSSGLSSSGSSSSGLSSGGSSSGYETDDPYGEDDGFSSGSGGSGGGYGSRTDPQWYYGGKGSSYATSGSFVKSSVSSGGFGCKGGGRVGG
ncbi:hypothetical protein E0L36_25880 [Streptomyces sp. AJS327]|uniref:hypothetical protein n=1 Tax=Streptomyces sp. AJS327 TaxID=2545265 RepID=UPI0015DDC469|nr:hypothetical protein [Streptomyces sp. AJS327]MBA0054157.1 hypothetical protein [Streptomyces sp. AJS327]